MPQRQNTMPSSYSPRQRIHPILAHLLPSSHCLSRRFLSTTYQSDNSSFALAAMSAEFSGRHMPALFAASTTSIGGFWPLFFPGRGTARVWLPRARRKRTRGTPRHDGQRRPHDGPRRHHVLSSIFAACSKSGDILLTLMGGYLGLVDSYVCWRRGNPGKRPSFGW